MKKRFINLAAVTSVNRKRLVCASLCLILCLNIASAQVKLSFNPGPNAKYEYLSESVQNIKQSVMGQEMPMEMEMNATYLMEVKNKTPQEINTQMTYQGFTFSVSSPMMNIKYDSKKPIDNPSEMGKMIERMFSAIIDKSFTMVVAPNGSVKSVSGMGAIIESMLSAISADGQAAAQMAAQMSQQFSDENIKNMLGQSFFVYPDDAIKVGDSWNMENTMSINNINFGIKARNTLREVNSNMATIAVAGDIDLDMGEGKLTGTQTGSTIVDTVTGLPVTSDVSINMKGNINTQGMDVQVEMISKTKTSVKEIK